MKNYSVELRKVKKLEVEIKAENSQHLIEIIKKIYPDYEMYGFKLIEEQELIKPE